MTTSAVTKFPTPVFNIADVASCFGGKDKNTLCMDSQGLVRSVETVLLPNTLVTLIEKVDFLYIWKIKTKAYDYPGDLYIDDRFVERVNFQEQKKELPSLSTILQKMQSCEGGRYILGGNWPEGVAELPQFYPSGVPFHELPISIQEIWMLKGVDCSGLLYYATEGYTPRNTSSLIHFGEAVPIENKSAKEIFETLKSLDLIVWKGHVICLLDQNTTIESILPGGVVKSNTLKRLEQICNDRKPVNDWESTQDPRFVIRRFV